MKDKTTGLVLLCLGVLLYATQHLADAVIRSGDLAISSIRFKEINSANKGMLAIALLLTLLGISVLVQSSRRKSGDD